MRKDILIKGVFALFSTAITYHLGGWDSLLRTLVFFMTVDIVTGLTASATKGKLSSAVGAKGLARKVGIIVLVAVGVKIDEITGYSSFIRDTVIFFFLANELLSIVENLGVVGIPIPPVITRSIEILRGRGEQTEEKEAEAKME